MIPRLGGGGPLLSLAAAHANPSLLLLHGTPARGTPPHNLAAKGLRSRARAPRWLSTAGAWLGSRDRDDHATRLVLAPDPLISVDPVVRWISIRWMAERTQGILGLPRARYSSNPQPLRGLTLPTHVGWNACDSRVRARWGSRPCEAHEPLCLSAGLPCVGLLPTILSERPPFSGSRPPVAQ